MKSSVRISTGDLHFLAPLQMKLEPVWCTGSIKRRDIVSFAL